MSYQRPLSPEAPAVPPSAAPAPTPTVAPKPATTTAKPKAPVVPPAIPAAPSVQQKPFVMNSHAEVFGKHWKAIFLVLSECHGNHTAKLISRSDLLKSYRSSKQKSGVKFKKFGQLQIYSTRNGDHSTQTYRF